MAKKNAPDTKKEKSEATDAQEQVESAKEKKASKKPSEKKKKEDKKVEKKADKKAETKPEEKTESAADEVVPESDLPQNILLFGEHAVEDKIIYISQDAYKVIHRFTKDKTKVETGGVLMGRVVEEFGKTHILIDGFIEAKHSEGTPTTLTFTHESWEYIHKTAAVKYPDDKIVGWIHTHPNFGIFLSNYDKFIQENFFNGENQVAYVVDPIQKIEGFYFWINGKIESCKGFYVFDKPGTPIAIKEEKAPVEEEKEIVVAKSSLLKDILLYALALLVIVLFFIVASLSRQIKDMNWVNDRQQFLETQEQYYEQSYEEYLQRQQQQIIIPSQQPTTAPSATATQAAEEPVVVENDAE